MFCFQFVTPACLCGLMGRYKKVYTSTTLVKYISHYGIHLNQVPRVLRYFVFETHHQDYCNNKKTLSRRCYLRGNFKQKKKAKNTAVITRLVSHLISFAEQPPTLLQAASSGVQSSDHIVLVLSLYLWVETQSSWWGRGWRRWWWWFAIIFIVQLTDDPFQSKHVFYEYDSNVNKQGKKEKLRSSACTITSTRQQRKQMTQIFQLGRVYA